MQIPKFIILFIMLLVKGAAFGQVYLGISADLGNKVAIHPDAGETLKSPAFPSGRIRLLIQEELKNKWVLHYGVSAGILAYSIRAAEADSLLNDPEIYDSYTDAITFIDGHMAFGRHFSIRQKIFTMLVGGGATYYSETFVMGASSVWSGNSWEDVFEYRMESGEQKVKGFAKISVQANITPRFRLGLEYTHHFTQVLNGTYAFYHMKNPPSGTLSLTPKAISLLFIVRISKKNPVR